MSDLTTQQVEKISKPHPNGKLPNPTGKGGFAERKHDISPGGWRKENTISYQYNRFMNMSTKELAAWAKISDDDKTVAMVLAFNRVLAARKSLPDLKEITDRTEGKSKEFIDLNAQVGLTISTINYADANDSSTV
jgi:hypothetical protein